MEEAGLVLVAYRVKQKKIILKQKTKKEKTYLCCRQAVALVVCWM
jgi:hypothetical protein